MTFTRAIDNKLFPKNEEIFSWIKDLTQWGHRKTGTPQGRNSAKYIAGKFREFGLEDVRIETAPSLCMFVDRYDLAIEGEQLETFYINATNHKDETGRFSFNEEGEKQEFVYVGRGCKEDFQGLDLQGKIAVCSVVLPESDSIMAMADWFDNAEIYDPEGKMQKTLPRIDIYSPGEWPNNYFYAVKAGAAGFVGILENYMDDPYFYCEDYTENGEALGVDSMSIPGLWISRSAGKVLKEKFDAKPILEGVMMMDSRYEYKDALNVSGRIQGQKDDYILVHSHHDAAFAGAVQDASGVSEMLAVCKYFSQLPKGSLKNSMMFAATDTHFTDYAGHQAFVRQRKEEQDNILLDVVIEHIGKEAGLDQDGHLYESGEPETGLVYVSADDDLYEFTKQAFMEYGIDKSIFAHVGVGRGLDKEAEAGYEFKQDEVISDGYYFNLDGTPVISMVCGELYLFHPSDTPDRIPVERLGPVGMAFAEIAMKANRVME